MNKCYLGFVLTPIVIDATGGISKYLEYHNYDINEINKKGNREKYIIEYIYKLTNGILMSYDDNTGYLYVSTPDDWLALAQILFEDNQVMYGVLYDTRCNITDNGGDL